MGPITNRSTTRCQTWQVKLEGWGIYCVCIVCCWWTKYNDELVTSSSNSDTLFSIFPTVHIGTLLDHGREAAVCCLSPGPYHIYSSFAIIRRHSDRRSVRHGCCYQAPTRMLTTDTHFIATTFPFLLCFPFCALAFPSRTPDRVLCQLFLLFCFSDAPTIDVSMSFIQNGRFSGFWLPNRQNRDRNRGQTGSASLSP